jgi:pyruvate kinase
METARRMAMVWGAHSCKTRDVANLAEMVGKAARFSVREEFAALGDTIIVTAGVPFGTPGATNTVRIAVISEELLQRNNAEL